MVVPNSITSIETNDKAKLITIEPIIDTMAYILVFLNPPVEPTITDVGILAVLAKLRITIDTSNIKFT